MSDLRNIAYPPLEPQALREFLREQHLDAEHDRDELVSELSRIPERIETAEAHAAATNALSKRTSLAKRLKLLREGAKAPILDAGRIIDAFFNVDLLKPVADLAGPIDAEDGRYMRAEAARKAEEARRVEEAKRREAQRLADEAREAERRKRTQEGAPALRVEAAEATEAAEAARKIATAKPAELARTRTAEGGGATLVEETDFEIIDPDEVARAFCSPDEKRIRNAVREAVRLGTIDDLKKKLGKGVRIFTRTLRRSI